MLCNTTDITDTAISRDRKSTLKKENTDKGCRNSNIELLRIIMMILLIAHHLVVNSGVDVYHVGDLSMKTVFMQIFGMWGKTAINVFTLITGYFMINKELKIKKLLKLALEIYFYVIASFLIFTVARYQPFSLNELAKSLLCIPFEIGRYYTGSMIMMMLFIPLVNKIMKSLDRKQYSIILALLVFYFTILSSIKLYDSFNFVIWLITVYLIGGFIKLYPMKIDRFKYGVIGMVASITLMIISILGIDLFGNKIKIQDPSFFFSDANKVFALSTSVFVFIFFKNLRIKNSKIINRMASTTFGVLLVHSCSSSVRKLLWVDIFDIAGRYQNGSLSVFFYLVIVVLGIYVVAVAIDLLRQEFIEKPVFKKMESQLWINKNLWE